MSSPLRNESVPASDAAYLQIITAKIAVCRAYQPKFGQGENVSFEEFQALYGGDQFYSWFGLDHPLMYAAHKAAGGITSLYRQIGIGCEQLFRRILQDHLGLTEAQANWSYTFPARRKKACRLSLDGRIHLDDLKPGARARVVKWLDAALTLFAAKGYVATGTQEIIDAAGVTKPVLYHYFESKEALFRELVGGIYDATAAAWDTVLAQEGKAVERLRGILRVSFEGSARDPRLPRLLLQTHYGPPIAELRAFMEDHTARRFGAVVEIIAAGLADDELRGGDAPSLALLFCSIMDQHINALTRLPNGPALLTPDRADAILDAFLHGCGTTRRGPVSLPPLPFG